MKLALEINKKINEFLKLCQIHKVKNLYAFGSSVTGPFDEKTSDIDLLVEMEEGDPIERGENLMSLWDKFEEFFNRKVDLLTETSIRNPVLRKKIEATKVKIYDGRGHKVLI